ncbi:MAG: acetyl-CoA carboxylase, biotin carboxyl carrier protein [Bacteroidetes bacterium 4572_117]|nr:MAG: acetyl-CoA carboxylase, biotin carboxyl carrier protein [Bacteroidetes bacterium 4572_117]
MELKELQDFIKNIAKSGATEVKIETGDLKLTIKTPPKGKAAQTHTETTVVQGFPIQTQMTGIPQMQMAPTMQTMPPIQQVTPTEVTKEEEGSSKYIEIKAPMVGTFYRKPAPDKPTYVNVGDEVNPGDIICIIEAMKLFNEIESEISGKIIKVLVDDSTPVEFDQPLYIIDPS